jgi:hypothetical protein
MALGFAVGTREEFLEPRAPSVTCSRTSTFRKAAINMVAARLSGLDLTCAGSCRRSLTIESLALSPCWTESE